METQELHLRLRRLVSLVGSDPGFYVLALHSFIESFVDGDCADCVMEEKFSEKLWIYWERLRATGINDRTARGTIVKIQKEHTFTNHVRHRFEELRKPDAEMATFNFVEFCRIVGIPKSDEFEKLGRLLEEWEHRERASTAIDELRTVKFRLFTTQRDNKQLLEKLETFNENEVKLAEYNIHIAHLTDALDKERTRAGRNGERVDELRRNLNELRTAKQELAQLQEQYKDTEEYIQNLQRLSLYARTRRDYERSITRLTPEQQNAVDAIQLSGDFLVRGSAGTGKTVVLLEALRKAADATEAKTANSLRPYILLTYTKTLVKYSEYLAEIIHANTVGGSISTADSYFLRKLKSIHARYFVDYSLMEGVLGELNTTSFLTTPQLLLEIEDFIFGNGITEEEYIDRRIPRRGLKIPLNNAQRREVWEIRTKCVEQMEKRGTFGKNYSRLKILENLEGIERFSVPESLHDCQFIFVDETQDLSAMELRILRKSAAHGVIMAGDTDQVIYGASSPYARSGLSIGGRTRHLRTNFRNTSAIFDLAEQFRTSKGENSDRESDGTVAFREGPPVELYQAGSVSELIDFIAKRVDLFVNRLGYDPENIAVLAPSGEDLKRVQSGLASRGFDSVDVRPDTFSFEDTGHIRLSTLHSSKGVDFPVVLLYLPNALRVPEYDERSAENLQRNLLYVAMTRAMDNLNLFILDTIDDPLVQALRDLVGQAERDQSGTEQGTVAETAREAWRSVD